MEGLKKIFALKKDGNQPNSEAQNATNSNDSKLSYYESGLAASRKALGSPINLITCLSGVYNSFENHCRTQEIEQENLKRPYVEEANKHKSEIKKFETLKEIHEDKLNNVLQEVDTAKQDIIDVKNSPEEYGLNIENKPKANFRIGLLLLIPITIYLLVFYISASYSAFFKVFDDDSLSSAIFDGASLAKAWEESILEAVLILTIPFVFMGLGYIIYMLEKEKAKGFIFKLIGLYLMTFLFDGLLAYVIDKKIYDFNKTPSSPDFNFSVALQSSEFWMIIFAGFVVYVIWGLVFSFIMKEYDNLDKINVFVKSKKSEIKNLLESKNKIKEELNRVKTKTSEAQGNINELNAKIQGFIFPVKTYLHFHHQYVEGWNTAISAELAMAKKQKDQLLLECKKVCDDHLVNLNLHEATEQNIIYTNKN